MRLYDFDGLMVDAPDANLTPRELRLLSLWGLLMTALNPGKRPYRLTFGPCQEGWIVGNQHSKVLARRATREEAVERCLVCVIGGIHAELWKMNPDQDLEGVVDYLLSDDPLPPEIRTMTVSSIAPFIAQHIAQRGLDEARARSRRNQDQTPANPKPPETPVPQETIVNPTGTQPLVRHADTIRERLRNLTEGTGGAVLRMIDAVLGSDPPKEEYTFDLRPYTLPRETRQAIYATLVNQGYAVRTIGTGPEMPGSGIPEVVDTLIVTVPREPKGDPQR